MTNPASITDTNDKTVSTMNFDNGLENSLDHIDDLNYATLTDALEQTVFENFDDGLYIGMMSGTSLDGMDALPFVNSVVKKKIANNRCDC